MNVDVSAIRARPRLVGRGSELEAIRGMVDAVGRGRGGIAVVSGEAGIGKTRLLEEGMAAARTGGTTICVGVADELERMRPFGVMVDALGLQPEAEDDDRRAIASLLTAAPVSTASPLGRSTELRFRIADDIVSLVDRLSGRGPLVLALEDLHWADDETLATVGRLSRFLGQLPVLLLLTLRPVPESHELRALLDRLEARGAIRVRLGPLPEGDATSLAEGLLAATPGERLRKLIRAAGGNPLFIADVLDTLGREGVLEFSAGYAELPTESAPRSHSRMALRRLDALSSETANILHIAAVLGSTFDVSDLSLVSGKLATDLLPHIDEAIRSEVLADHGGRVAFRHDLLREAVYANLTPSLRKALHLQAARAFAAAGAPADKVAAQMSLGAEVGDEDAVRWLRDAASAAAHGPAVRLELLERAVAIAGPGYSQLAVLLAEKAVALVWCFRPKEAENLARTVFEMTLDQDLAVAVHAAMAEALLLQARFGEAADHLKAVLDAPTSRGRTAAMAAYAMAVTITGDVKAGADYARRAFAAAQAEGDKAAKDLARGVLAMEAWFNGDTHSLGQLAAEGNCALDEERGPVTSLWRLQALVLGLIESDLNRLADENLAALGALAERTRAISIEWVLQFSRVCRDFATGEWDDAWTEAEAALAFADEHDMDWGWMVLRPSFVQIAIHRDELDIAERALPSEQEIAQRGPNMYAFAMLWMKALLTEARGDIKGAAALMRQAEADRTQSAPITAAPLVLLDMVRLALGSGDLGMARTSLAEINKVATSLGTPTARGAALRARGLVEGDRDMLRQAVGAFREACRPLELAAACEDAGVAMVPDPEGANLMREALDIYHRLDARRDVARLEMRMRGVGLRRGARGRRSRPSTGWDSLTETEQRVVGLVAEGLSNPDIARRLFVSKYTVQTHLAHIFVKLAVSSRVELATSWARRHG